MNTEIKEFIDKGLNEGLNIEDYHALKRLLNQYIENGNNEEELAIIKLLLSILYYNDVAHKFSKEVINYLKSNTMLLPLVLSNNELDNIKMIFDDSFMFLCPFHDDKNPSFSVRDSINIGHCFSCNKTVNAISYLSFYENIKFTHAVELLSNVYLINIEEYSRRKREISKYRKTILGKKYQKLLYQAYNNLIDNYGETSEICSEYQKRVDIINRIRKNEYDNSMIPILKPKKYVLSKEDIGDLL